MLHGLQAFYNVTCAQKSPFTSQHSAVDKDQVDRLSYTGGFSEVLNTASLRQHVEVFMSPPEHHLINSTSGGEAWPWVVWNLPSDSPVQPGLRITALMPVSTAGTHFHGSEPLLCTFLCLKWLSSPFLPGAMVILPG